MDPLTHTLVGVTLAESGLKRRTRLATATLVIGANLPDIDGIANFLGRDTALWMRRGWTHGVAALVILPLVLAGIMYAWSRLVRGPDKGMEVRIPVLLALSYVSVLTHPALDWLNNYGIRLLMPFDGRWFYGDAVFIIDPWLWLVLGTSAVLASTRTWIGVTGWMLLAGAGTWLMFAVGVVPMAARVVWLIGVLTVAALRGWGRWNVRAPRLAGVCLALAFVYIAAMIVGTRLAHSHVDGWLETQRLHATSVMAGPVPANPFRRQIIIETVDRYHFLELDWLADPQLRESGSSMARVEVTPPIAAALRAPAVRGLSGWLRFPAFELETLPDGYRVRIRDMRFARTFATGLGAAVVELDSNLRPREPPSP